MGRTCRNEGKVLTLRAAKDAAAAGDPSAGQSRTAASAIGATISTATAIVPDAEAQNRARAVRNSMNLS
jgi:hypothetical protein